VPIPGLYQVSVNISRSVAGGYFEMWLSKTFNGTNNVVAYGVQSQYQTYFVTTSVTMQMEAGERLYVTAWQNSGGSAAIPWSDVIEQRRCNIQICFLST
jgi:hypothetical protein